MIKNIISSFILAQLLCYSLTVVAQESTKEVTTTAYPFYAADTCANAQVHVSYDSYQFGIVLNAGDSELAPYYISSNQGGCITQKNSVLAYASVHHGMKTSSRLSWGAGLTLVGGYTSSAGYDRYVGNGQFEIQKQHPARIWLQEAYVKGKYRSIFAVAGQDYKQSPIVNRALSSGDLVWSGNARPPVGLRAGFIDFQDIPFTKGVGATDGRVRLFP